MVSALLVLLGWVMASSAATSNASNSIGDASGFIQSIALGFAAFFGIVIVFAFASLGSYVLILSIAVGSRISDLGTLSQVTDKGAFDQLLKAYIKKISVHRVILWIFGAFPILLSLLSMSTSNCNFSGFCPALTFVFIQWFVAAIPIALGFVLSNQVRRLKSLEFGVN